MIPLYDAHNHLQDERFGGRQEELLAACRREGVVRMVVNGSEEGDWAAVAALARAHPQEAIPAFGCHPWYVGRASPEWRHSLREWLERFPRAPVGEIGLDRWRRGLEWETQVDFFRAQLALAAELNRPACLHCLKAWGRLVKLLREGPVPSRGFLLHSYGGPSELIPELAAMGGYFSLPGYFARPDKRARAEAFQRVPSDRLLLETDAPDQRLPPEREAHPLQSPDGRPLNHPANLAAVYRFAAELLGLSPERLAVQVEQNFHRLFGDALP